MPPALQGTPAGRILEAIVRHCGDHCGRAPTNREIGKLVGISSTSVVNYHLNRLQRAGVIRRDSIASRAIEIVGAAWTPPAELAHLVAGGEGGARGMTTPPQGWPFRKTHHIHPNVPMVEIELLNLPATAPALSCPICQGTGRGKGSDEYGWYRCECYLAPASAEAESIRGQS